MGPANAVAPKSSAAHKPKWVVFMLNSPIRMHLQLEAGHLRCSLIALPIHDYNGSIAIPVAQYQLLPVIGRAGSFDDVHFSNLFRIPIMVDHDVPSVPSAGLLAGSRSVRIFRINGNSAV